MGKIADIVNKSLPSDTSGMTKAECEYYKKQTTAKIMKVLAFIIFAGSVLAGYILAFIAVNTLDANSDIVRFINRHIFDNYGTANQLISTAIIIIVGFIVVTLLQFGIRLLAFKGTQRRKTIVSLIASFAKYIGYGVVVVMLLGAWDVDPTIIAAIIAALGIAIGFGAQGLISDLLAGLFIIFENSIKVGDYVTIGSFRGEVSEVGIRTTRVTAPTGNVLIVNNSELRSFVNMSMHRSAVITDVTVEYSENLQKVEKLLIENLVKIGDSIPAITECPAYKGVESFTERGVMLRIISKCDEISRLQVERDMSRALKLLFDKHKIKIALPKVEVVGMKK